MWHMVIFVSNFAKKCIEIKEQRFFKHLYIMLLFIYYIAPTYSIIIPTKMLVFPPESRQQILI